MAFSAANISGILARAWSIGPVKMELQTFSALTTDTSGTVTSGYLHQIDAAYLLSNGTLCLTSAPTISGNSVTLAMADPASACTGYVAQNVNGLVLLVGR